MHHVAIMKPSWQMIPKILSGQKTIESRWYQSRRTPWDRIKKGDTVFFKDSGKLITAQAKVADVLQFQIENVVMAKKIIRQYGQQICLVEKDPTKWGRMPKYCILVFLSKPQSLKQPFAINKKGFGSAAAWLTVGDITEII